MAWHDDEQFWETFAPALFSQERTRAAFSEVEGILGQVDTAELIDVLDLCCGTGRHSVELARRGYRVTGVDRHAPYLAKGRAVAEREALEIEWVHTDMREFVRPDGFDLAINFFTSFGFFADEAEERQVVNNLHASLRPGGTLILDLFGQELLLRAFRPRDWCRLEDGSLWLEERELDEARSRLRARWILIRDGSQKEKEMELRLYTADALTQLLSDAGFERVDIYGHLDGRPYDEGAERLVAVAQR